MQDTTTSIIPVVQLGNLKASEIAGYYFVHMDVRSPTRVEIAGRISPLVHMYTQHAPLGSFDSPQFADILRALGPLGLCIFAFWDSFTAEPEKYKNSRPYLIPHKKNETVDQVKERILNASGTNKVMKVGYIQSGKIKWVGSPTLIAPKYSQEFPMSVEQWKIALLGSPLLRLIAEQGTRSLLTPQEMVLCDFIPTKLVPKPEKVLYQKGSGEKIFLDVSAFEAKVTKKRRVQDPHYTGFEYTNGVSIVSLVKDFIDGKLPKPSVVIPGRDQEYFLEASQNLALGCRIPEAPRVTDQDIQGIVTTQSKIRVQKIKGINGFGAVAEESFEKGDIIGIYAGEMTDHIPFTDQCGFYTYNICIENAVAISNNFGVKSYRKGNFVGLVNHSKESNAEAELRVYGSFVLICYVAIKNIPAGVQLLVNYGDFPEAHTSLSFTLSGGIIFDKAANAMATAVYKQGVEFFTAGKLPEAKRAFKQAVGLTENAPDANLEKAQFQRSLGTTYFKLIDKNKEKYPSRAKFFLEAAQKHSKYAEDTEIKKKLTAL